MCGADAVVRGHRSGLLTAADYNNLAQCESLDDIKLNLVRVLRTRCAVGCCVIDTPHNLRIIMHPGRASLLSAITRAYNASISSRCR